MLVSLAVFMDGKFRLDKNSSVGHGHI